MRLKTATIALSAVFCLTLLGPAAGHDARLDGNGCHDNKPYGGYHCHRGPLAGQYFRDRKEAERYLPRRTEQKPRRRRNPDHIFGRAKVIDGDTIEVRGNRVRLYGINAFHRKQRCRKADGDRYRCGRRATRALKKRIEDKRIACQRKSTRRNRILAVCWRDAEDIGAWMVLSGWAMADDQHGATYRILERRAERRRAGAWQGRFRRPEDWRKRRRNR